MSETAKKRVRGKADLNRAAPHRGVTHKKPAFLEAFRITCNATAAAKAIGVNRSTVYREWLAKDPAFREAFLAAEQEATDNLVEEARRRAYAGIERYVVSAGRLIMDPDQPDRPLIQREYSDKLMELLLRSHRPEVYGNRTAIEHSGSVRTIQELLIGIPAGQEDESVPLLGEGSVDVLTDGSS